MQTRIKAIFFDFDGVLTLNERGSTVTIKVIHEANPDIPAAKVEECYYRFHRKLLLGESDHFGIWSDFCERIGKEINPGILEEAFLATPMNEEMVLLASELAERYRLGMITDNAADRMHCLIAKHGLDTLFDPIVISAEVGRRKDGPALFEHALRLVGCEPGECVFIDNQERNLIAPAKLGFKTHLFDAKQSDIKALRSQLSAWGVAVR